MAFIPVPDTAMVELVYNFYSFKMENVFYYSGLAVDDPATLEGLCADALTQWYATFRIWQHSQLSLFQIKATDLTSESGPTAVLTPTTGNVGTATGDALPFNVALLLSVHTAKRGKSYRGRLYIPGMCEPRCVASTFDSELVDAMQAAFSYWDYLDVNGEPYAMQIVSRYHNGAPRTLGVHTDVSGWTAQPIVASQRRRLPGRGA